MEEINKGIQDKEQLQECEEKAILKYEKNSKPYRQNKYRPTIKTIKCQKCGATHTLTKVEHEGNTYWFCKDCIIQRAIELKNKKEG